MCNSTTTATSTNYNNKKPRQYKRHMAPMHDEVELWPRPTSSDHPSATVQDNDKETPIGANIDYPSTFYGLSPLDHLRVCGFHMHALEWHHMQTVGIDQILRLAEKTHCPVFNLSVVRWLGEQIRKPAKSTGTSTRITTKTNVTRTQSKSKDKGAMSMIMGMDLKLFHKMGCLCKKEAALVRTSTLHPPTPSSSSLASFSRRGATSSSSVQQEKQFWIACRTRAETKSSFEILDRGGSSEWGNRNFLGVHGTMITSGFGSGSSRRGRKVIPAGIGMGVPGQFCSFAVPLEIANFGHNRAPIHSQVETSTWLSHWLSPPSALSLSHPPPFYTSTTSKQTVSAVKGSPTGWKLQQPVISSQPGQLMTTHYLELNEWPWSAPLLYSEDVQSQSQERGKRDYNKDDHIRQQFDRWKENPRQTKQVQEKYNLERLDEELQEALARHVKVLKAKMGVDEEGYSIEMQEDNLGSRFYKKIDIDANSTVSLQLCKDCRKGVHESCVIPRHRHDHHHSPPLPSLSPPLSAESLDHLIQFDVDMDVYTDVVVQAEAECDQELGQVDRVLGEVMTRHAERVQRIMEAQVPVSPIRVNLARPKCFCGFTSIAVYPDLSSSSPDSSSSSASDSVRKTNWVYECHFTPKQRGMVKPDTCEDCEEDRQRHLVRVKGHAANNNCNSYSHNSKEDTPLTGTCLEDNNYNSSGAGVAETAGKNYPVRIRHQAERVDQVELWPKGSSSAAATTTRPTKITTTIGADIGNPGIFLGLGAMDGKKVCGFHMHALEWHHMQTVGIDQILDLAKLTGCEVFNMSIMRWLSDSVRSLSNTLVSTGISPTASSTSNDRNSSTRTSSNATSKNDLASNSIAGLSLKLFRRIQCYCRREAAIAVTPKPIPLIPVSSRSTTTTTTRTATQTTAAKEKRKQYVVVCRGRAYQDPTFEICDRPLEGDALYGYYNRSRVQSGGTVPSCTFCINLEIAIYGHAVEAIHKCIPTTPWLAQRLSPFNKVLSRSSAQPIPTSWSTRISRPISAVPFSSSSSRMSSDGTGASSPRLTDQMVSTIQRSLTLSETARRSSRKTTDTKSPTAPTTTTIPAGPPPSRLLTAWDLGVSGQLPRTSLSASILPNAELMQKQQQGLQDGTRKRTITTSTKGVSRLVELDRKLEETVAWHVAEVTSIMEDATQDHRSSSRSSTQDYAPAWQQYSNYNEIDMTEYPGIAMHICQWCKDNARDFCVVPTLKNQPGPTSRASNTRYTASMTNEDRRTGAAAASVDWPLPPSPPRSPDELMDMIESDADRDRVTYTELERVDKELDRVMRRHAAEVQEKMESRSRLLPDLLLCRGCEFRTTMTRGSTGGDDVDAGGGNGGRDVLPCCHALLCIDCIKTVEFYLVPRATTAIGRSLSE
ncbi:hypothetical protein BGZ47_000489 [Haplosporangium gracile]|nr:hypothetical protein BGZ47_000489 [Haplosporangium gracile]